MRRLAIHSNAEMYAWINTRRVQENLTCLLFMEMPQNGHSRIKKRNVALIEKCVMSRMVLRVYSESLRVTLISSIPIQSGVISGCHVADLVCGGHFFFSAMRSARREGLSCLTELAISFRVPGV